MKWSELTLIVVGVYLLYYAINLIIDVSKAKKLSTSGDNTMINFTDLEEEKPVNISDNFINDDFSEKATTFKEEEAVSIDSKEITEVKKEEKDSHEDIPPADSKKKPIKEEEDLQQKESSEEEPQDVKFQSMPVNDFLANAKKFSSQIDFS
ncbi:hypothetical protein [Tenacibaculum maritimum]|uniref:hypothetical protein n=1 Tax=Tenacibaculum maritimum TaxID=107401 RepID=UPI003876559D